MSENVESLHAKAPMAGSANVEKHEKDWTGVRFAGKPDGMAQNVALQRHHGLDSSGSPVNPPCQGDFVGHPAKGYRPQDGLESGIGSWAPNKCGELVLVSGSRNHFIFLRRDRKNNYLSQN